jgi:hypothetical protein
MAGCSKDGIGIGHSYNVFIDKGSTVSAGYCKICVHLVFDVKHDGQHKACLVTDGHLIDVPLESVYSGVVSLRGIHILVFLAELNKLELWATDRKCLSQSHNQHESLHHCREQIWRSKRACPCNKQGPVWTSNFG